MEGRAPGAKRRGAISNREGRFERFRVEALTDAEEIVSALRQELEHDPVSGAQIEWTPPQVTTTVTPEITRTIITRNESPDIPFDRSINPYKGCEHGCIYCFARPTHSFLGMSPGLDFETRIFSKPDAAALLREELRRPGYRCEVMALGSNTDPYQPAEREHKITRSVLEVLAEHGHPVGIVTKSSLVLRDLDILSAMAARNLAGVMISITTLNGELARRMEPRAASPARRLATIRSLSEAGVPVGVLSSPMIPGLNDTELESILRAAAESGAVSAGYTILRLPLEIKDLFAEWLREHYPLRADHVLALVRSMRGGRLNDPAFGSRMRGTGAYAELLRKRFDVARRRYGLDKGRAVLDTAQFSLPPRSGDQPSLF